MTPADGAGKSGQNGYLHLGAEFSLFRFAFFRSVLARLVVS